MPLNIKPPLVTPLCINRVLFQSNSRSLFVLFKMVNAKANGRIEVESPEEKK